MEKVKTICITCKRETVVRLVSFGGAYVGICSLPDCGGLAYNKDKEEDKKLRR